MYTQKRKSAARLGRLRLQGALAPANFFCAPRTKEKALLLSRWMCELP